MRGNTLSAMDPQHQQATAVCMVCHLAQLLYLTFDSAVVASLGVSVRQTSIPIIWKQTFCISRGNFVFIVFQIISNNIGLGGHTHSAMRSLISPAAGRLASCLLALLTHSCIQVGEGSQAGESSQVASSQSCSYSSPLQPPQEQPRTAEAKHLTPSAPAAGTLLDRITGGANPGNRRRKHSSRGAVGHQPRGGDGGPAPDAIEISGAELAVESTGGRPMQQQHLDGVYLREWDVNGAPHFKRRSKVCRSLRSYCCCEEREYLDKNLGCLCLDVCPKTKSSFAPAPEHEQPRR